MNSDILVKPYYALIYPFLTYGLISWSNTSSSATQPLFVSQKRAIRVLTFSKFREQSSPIFNALILLNCLTLSFLISQSLCITFTIDVCHLCLILSSHKLVKDTFIIQEVSGMIFLIKSEYKESFWRRADAQNFSFFYSLRWPIYVINSVVNAKLPAEYNEDWLIAILEGHFENVSIQVTRCDTSHVCKVVQKRHVKTCT